MSATANMKVDVAEPVALTPPAAAKTSIVSIKNVCKTYTRGVPRLALD